MRRMLLKDVMQLVKTECYHLKKIGLLTLAGIEQEDELSPAMNPKVVEVYTK